jgi:hypothetical protein
MSNDSANRAAPRKSTWRLPLLLAAVLAAIVAWRLYEMRPPQHVAHKQAANASGPTTKQVTLTVDFGKGEPKELFSAPWREGMTVADLLSSIHGLSIVQRGSGEGAFLSEINGTSNQGGAGSNWMFSVNGEDSDRSFAVYELHPDDRVLWTFTRQR